MTQRIPEHTVVRAGFRDSGIVPVVRREWRQSADRERHGEVENISSTANANQLQVSERRPWRLSTHSGPASRSKTLNSRTSVNLFARTPPAAPPIENLNQTHSAAREIFRGAHLLR